MGSSSLVVWLVPQEQKSNKAFIAKTKFVFGVAICMTLIAALNALRQFSVGHTTNGIMILLAAFLMLVSFIVFKFRGSLTFLCNSVTALLYFLITFLTFSFGGLSSNVGSWFGLVVLLGIMLTGKKYGLFWGLLSIVTVVVFYVAELNGVNFEAPPIKITGFFIGCFILCLAILGLAVIYEITTTNSKNQLNDERAQSEDQARILSAAISEVKQIMEGAAQSNLSQRLVGDYKDELLELKTSINSALEILDRTISGVSDVSKLFIGGSEQLWASTGELAETAQTQASTLTKISDSMREIEAKTKLNSDNATKARNIAGDTLNMVQNGQYKMEEMLQSIGEINQTSKEVTKIVRVIDEIAFQTNLLALNAAVEAARAGKYGKGFAVVAEEVRSLAGRSSSAAKDTTELVHKSEKQLENGVGLADQMADLQDNIVTSVEKVNSLIGEISGSSAEQSTEIKEINEGLVEVNNVVSSNSTLTSKTANLSHQLADKAMELKQTMHRFTLTLAEADPYAVRKEITYEQ